VKLVVVTPRYGTEVVGGAEMAARMVASNLAARTDWDVEVLTTCAQDATTWADAYAPGSDTVDGVPVRRFPVVRGRAADFDQYSNELFAPGHRADAAEQERWIDKQGPVAPQLIDAIGSSDADVVAFHPYLYHPTIAGVRRTRDRAVLHPAAHDEAPIYLPVYRDLVDAVQGLVYWSEPERRFVERVFATGARPQLVLGLGVEAGAGDAANARAALALGVAPFLVCLGRVDDGKGARLLATAFAAYKARRPGPLRLVFAGPVVHRPDDHPDIDVVGVVDEEVKWGLLRAAAAFVTPSAYESFSIVLMEAWSVGIPALVNGRCAVTADHARQSDGALTFSTYAELEVALDRVLGSDQLATELGANGRHYVERHFRWPDVTDRYDRFLRAVVSRRS
jgi:glycosyltransferase involved in cell wall biosynthesis